MLPGCLWTEAMESPSSTARRRAWINSSRQQPTREELDPDGPPCNLPSASTADNDVFSDGRSKFRRLWGIHPGSMRLCNNRWIELKDAHDPIRHRVDGEVVEDFTEKCYIYQTWITSSFRNRCNMNAMQSPVLLLHNWTCAKLFLKEGKCETE